MPLVLLGCFATLLSFSHAQQPKGKAKGGRGDAGSRFVQMEEAALAQPFVGVTADGKVEPGLFKIESTGVSTREVLDATNAFLAALTDEQRRKSTFAIDDNEWRRWANQHGLPRQGVTCEGMSGPQRELAVKMAGAAYLVYLGVRRLLARDDAAPQARAPQSLRRVFFQGVLVNVLNPKSALFFFAFLPQFVDVSRGTVAGQVLMLGAVFVALGVLSDGAYALLAGRLGRWLKHNLRFLRVQRYLTGGVYIALGLTTALAGSGKK